MWTIVETKYTSKPVETSQDVKIVPGDPSKILKIGSAFLASEKTKITTLLRKNQDVFTWSHKDMLKIDREIIQHHLNVNPECKLVQQIQRIFALECNKAVTEEVEKLLKASFIREVFNPDWLINVVMVKNNSKWRMCVDFTDLNKACSKDSFPLPRIDQLVDSTAGHNLLRFMDVFFGYNQILMDKEDQAKTVFVTSYTVTKPKA